MAVIQYARRYTCDLCAAEAEITHLGNGPDGWVQAQIAHDGSFWSLNLCGTCSARPYRQVEADLAKLLTARGE